MAREDCILDLDSPSFPPEMEEYRQCGCKYCLAALKDAEITDDDKSFERDMSNKYPVESEEP